jgi:hypothetical protein
MTRILLILSLFVTAPARAQEEVHAPPSALPEDEFRLPEPGEILPLRRGTAAPRDGLLIDAEDMLQIQQEYERMRFMLERVSERDRETCDVRVEMEHARLSACEERLRLRDELWDARQNELNDTIVEARAEARRAAERAWFESPVLWFIVGVVATSIVWIAATVGSL